MSLEKVRCNLNDEFEAEEAINLSLEAEIVAAQHVNASDGPIVTPSPPCSPIPVAVVQPRVASPFPVGNAEPDLLDLMEPVDPFDVPAPPTATPVPLDEVSLYGEVSADGDLADLDDGYVGLEQTARLYDEVGLGMEQLSENDEEVARINAFLDEDRPVSSLSELHINLDTPSTGVTSVTSYASLSEVDLTCNEEYEPNYGQVHFEDEASASGNNNESQSHSDTSASMTSASMSSAPPPYQPMGSYRCHQCGALNNVATTSWVSPPPPYAAVEAPATPTGEEHPPVEPEEPAEPLAAVPAAADDVDLNELFGGDDVPLNLRGNLPGVPDYSTAQPPQDYGQVEPVPFRDLMGPADTSDEEDK